MPSALTKETEEEPPRLQLSLVQVIAAALASITSAVILSKFGVAGTYVGTAIGSVVSTVTVALYSHTMRQARRRVRTYAQHHHAGTVIQDAPPVRTPPAAWNRSHPRPLPPVTVRASRRGRPGWLQLWDRLDGWFAGLPLWGKAGVTAATAFVLAVATVVLFQFLSGHSLTNVWGMGRSSNGPNAGCVIGECGGTPPTPAQRLVPTPGATSQPAEQPSAAPTTQPTPTATPAAQPTPAATPLPSPAPSPVPTPSP